MSDEPRKPGAVDTAEPEPLTRVADGLVTGVGAAEVRTGRFRKYPRAKIPVPDGETDADKVRDLGGPMAGALLESTNRALVAAARGEPLVPRGGPSYGDRVEVDPSGQPVVDMPPPGEAVGRGQGNVVALPYPVSSPLFGAGQGTPNLKILAGSTDADGSDDPVEDTESVVEDAVEAGASTSDFAPRTLPCARRTRCTSSSACTRSSGTGMARQWVLRRFRVAIRTSFASRSTSHARRPSASETRHPVIARVRARVCTAGFGCARATARNRSRSGPVRYLRPRASTSSLIIALRPTGLRTRNDTLAYGN